ncbi:MAG: oligosaccharide flippase family protein [Gammaproteobacteria bacterium]|nr:oligosaccharide flippase family protein [Gammaproteobacteria bacterium]
MRVNSGILVKHVSAYFIARVAPASIAFVALCVYTRLLSPSEYGVFALIYSIANLAMSIIFGSLGLSTARFWPGVSSEKEKKEFLSTYYYLILVLMLTTLLFSSVFFIFFHISSKYAVIILLGVGVFIARSLFRVNLDYLRAELNPFVYGLMNFSKALLSLLVSILLIYLIHGVNGLLLGVIVGNLLTLLLFRKSNSRWRHVDIRFFNVAALKQILIYSLPLSVGFALAYIVNSSDRWLIAGLLSVKQAGFYSAASALPTQSLVILMAVVNLAIYPIVVRVYKEKGEAAAKEQLSKQFLLFFALALPACCGFIILRHNIVFFALGVQFRAIALGLIPWLVIAALFSGIKAYYTDVGFQLSKHTFSQLMVSLIVAISNVALNLLFIPVYGIKGSVFASAISYALGLVCSIVYGRRYFKLPFPVGKLWRIIVPTCVMSLFLFYMRNLHGVYYLFLQGFLGMFIYAIAGVLINKKYVSDIVGMRNKGCD